MMNNSFINPDNNKGFLYLKEIQEKYPGNVPWAGNGGIIDVTAEGKFIDIGLQTCRFLYKFLNSIKVEDKPIEILEFGTNYGSFSWVLYESLGNDFRLKTCDVVEKSGECINSLNKIYNSNQVEFKHTGSADYIPELIQQDYKPDIIYIDGNHSFEGCLNDFENSFLLKPSYIIVDDYSELKDIRKALHKFLYDTDDYKMFKYSNINYSVGSQVILKLVENG